MRFPAGPATCRQDRMPSAPVPQTRSSRDRATAVPRHWSPFGL